MLPGKAFKFRPIRCEVSTADIFLFVVHFHRYFIFIKKKTQFTNVYYNNTHTLHRTLAFNLYIYQVTCPGKH